MQWKLPHGNFRMRKHPAGGASSAAVGLTAPGGGLDSALMKRLVLLLALLVSAAALPSCTFANNIVQGAGRTVQSAGHAFGLR